MCAMCVSHDVCAVTRQAYPTTNFVSSYIKRVMFVFGWFGIVIVCSMVQLVREVQYVCALDFFDDVHTHF